MSRTNASPTSPARPSTRRSSKANNVSFGQPIGIQLKSFDVSPQVAQALERKPEVIAVAGTPDSAGKVIKELRRQGFTGRVIGSQIFADPNSLDLFGRDADGMIIVAGFWWDRNDATRAFTKKFAEENVKRGPASKKIPHHTDAQAYDIVYLLKQAMEKANVTGDPAKLAQERTAIRDALQGIRFTGVTGDNTCFNADRDARLPGLRDRDQGPQMEPVRLLARRHLPVAATVGVVSARRANGDCARGGLRCGIGTNG